MKEMKIHLVYPGDYENLKDALVEKGHQVLEWDYTLDQFTVFSQQKKFEVDVAIIEGTAGLNNKQDIYESLKEIRKNLPHARLILVFPESIKHDRNWVSNIVSLAIYDLYFVEEYSIEDIEKWLKITKSIADHLDVQIKELSMEKAQPINSHSKFQREQQEENSQRFISKIVDQGRTSLEYISSRQKEYRKKSVEAFPSEKVVKSGIKMPRYQTKTIGVCSPVSSGKTFFLYHLIQQLGGLSLAVVDPKKSLTYLSDEMTVFIDIPNYGEYDVVLIEVNDDKTELPQMDVVIIIASPYPHHLEKTERTILKHASTGNPVYIVMNQWDNETPFSPESMLNTNVHLTIPYEKQWLTASWAKERLNAPWLNEMENLWFRIIKGGQIN
jgi:hypothetical protein